MFERVKESAKTLETELKLFRQQKEVELKQLISEFVNIQKKTNDKMKNHWSNFLQKSQINNNEFNSINNPASFGNNPHF